MPRLFLIAGETSGDRHAAGLVAELARQDPGSRFHGLGGPQMQAAGVSLTADLTRHAVVGTVEVVTHLATLARLYRKATRALDAWRPDAVVLVDYPGFNLRFAREAKRRRIPVLYYVSPQIWAWGANRIRTIQQRVDLMLVLFPFEERLYRAAGIPVQWVGHPLLDTVRVTQPRADTLLAHHLSPHQPVVGVLPGSRVAEVQTLLPILVKAADRLAIQKPGLQAVVLKTAGLPEPLYQRVLSGNHLARLCLAEWNHNLLAACDLALVASGTATLECALLDLPMVIVYQAHPITWWLGKRLVKLPYLGLVNVVAGRRLVPECLQGEAIPSRIAEAASQILQSEQARHQMIAGFQEIRSSLGGPGASRRAAEAVLAALRKG